VVRLKCDAILFDLDGVLIDSSLCVTRHWAAWAREHGLPLERIMAAAHGMRTIETMRIVAPELDVEVEAAMYLANELADMDGVVPIEGAVSLLKALPAGAWSVVTSAGRDLAKARLRHVGLPVPRVLVSGDDVSRGKPSPEPYLAAALGLGSSPSSCLAVEDAPSGIAAAQAAGMKVVGVLTTHAREDLDCPVAVDRLGDLAVNVAEDDDGRLVVSLKTLAT
jgi:sugar-phosphatase